jgi:hypothetical protein
VGGGEQTGFGAAPDFVIMEKVLAAVGKPNPKPAPWLVIMGKVLLG